MLECGRCGGSIEERYRFCPWCAAPLRLKLVDFFAGTGDEAGKALRVSRYVLEGHVRFSVWDEDGVAEAAVSIAEDDAARLAGFLSPEPRPAPARDAAPPAA